MKHLRIFFFLFSIFVIIVLSIVIIKNYVYTLYNHAASPPANTASITEVQEPSPDTEVETPDGTLKIVMNKQNRTEGDFAYSFFTESSDGQNKKLLYSAIGPKDLFSLSPNSWSPDNAYLFLTKHENRGINALVFKASGETMRENIPYLDVASLFQKAVPDFKINEVTGWDSPTLLHVWTNKGDSQSIITYWFDVVGRTFIQLAR